MAKKILNQDDLTKSLSTAVIEVDHNATVRHQAAQAILKLAQMVMNDINVPVPGTINMAHESKIKGGQRGLKLIKDDFAAKGFESECSGKTYFAAKRQEGCVYIRVYVEHTTTPNTD